MMALSSPLMEITVDGDNMVIKNSSLLRTVEMKFKLGEEYEEKMPSTTIKVIIIIEYFKFTIKLKNLKLETHNHHHV